MPRRGKIRLELPGNWTVGILLIGAEVAGADCGGEMPPECGMLESDLLQDRADVLADRPARSFRANRGCTRTPARSRGSGELLPEHLDLDAQAFGASEVIHSIGLIKVAMQIVQSRAVLGSRL